MFAEDINDFAQKCKRTSRYKKKEALDIKQRIFWD